MKINIIQIIMYLLIIDSKKQKKHNLFFKIDLYFFNKIIKMRFCLKR